MNIVTLTTGKCRTHPGDFVLADTTTVGAFDVLLPPVSEGGPIQVHNVTGTNAVTVKTDDGAEIDGASGSTGIAYAAAQTGATFMSDFVRWYSIPTASSGGSGPSVQGAAIVRAFPFTHATAGLLTGAALYTPTIGDVLLDAWLESDGLWDGTTPMGDIGQFVGGSSGLYRTSWYGSGSAPAVDMTTASGGLPSGQTPMTIATYQAAGMLFYFSEVPAIASVPSSAQNLVAPIGDVGSPLAASVALPARFTTADPFKVCVSQDGTNVGGNPGSTVGAGTLYLVTATPAT